MQIHADTSQLAEKSGEMQALTAELRHTMEQTEALVLSLNGPWQGDAERAFSEKILYVNRQFDSIATFFDDCAALLKRFAQAYEQQESDLSSKINLA